ncbi:hypothetical protein BC832DRAFT_554160 [Gaertneriomyces semiglobifer]|nr:hypothetical protein BC832DRAFT_554160 [Gaertneriomyces semiglobifer]
MTSPLLLKVFNTIAYIFFLSSSVYNVVGPDGKYDYGSHPTYLTPAPFAFAIWGLIHFLFLGFVIWQWFGDSDDVVTKGYGGYFIIAALLTSVWHDYWESGHLVLSLIVLLFASASITVIYHNLRSLPPKSTAEHIFVHAPISLYHGWLIFIGWLNIFAVFTSVADPAHPDLLHRILVFLVMLQLTGTAVAYTEFRNKEIGDVPGALTIAWALFGVSAQQQSKFIEVSALVMGIVVCMYAFRPMAKSRGSIGERQPLLGEPEEQV